MQSTSLPAVACEAEVRGTNHDWEGRVNSLENFDSICAAEDERFDLLYPPHILALSSQHWTPATVARTAAEFLVPEPNTRVLDIGCGPGKFCIVGAQTTDGHFTGVEQRPELANVGRVSIERERIANAVILNANITEIDFKDYDSFYLFNPFEENIFKMGCIDSSVHLSTELYALYVRHVARMLAKAPLGTRVATYHGLCEEVPLCYELIHSRFKGELQFWQKRRN